MLAEAQALAALGVREINLIAQDLTAYGRDLRPTSSLAELLRGLNEIESLHWIRLLYCYPNFVTAELLDAIAELPKVVKYIDIPLQHADDDVLRAMKRERSGDGLRRLLDRIRQRIPGVARFVPHLLLAFRVRTTRPIVICWPSCRSKSSIAWESSLIRGRKTPAALDLANQVSERLKRERRAAVMELQASISHTRNQLLAGHELEVLVEDSMPGQTLRMRGRTAAQAPEIDGMVMLKGEGQPGEFFRARITRALTYDLHGAIIDQAGNS